MKNIFMLTNKSERKIGGKRFSVILLLLCLSLFTVYGQGKKNIKGLKFPTLINRWKNNSLSNFLCKLVIDKQLISKAKQQNCYGSKNRENI